ncbi:MAG TPA: ABC transporter substrate-binding protein [Methylomirabilota bacterium]|jgi:putative ABC transport system substrate-binding protein|nr:ABC transporter substrate-binding protein [Methylomirabilota bacterium]
MSGRPGRVVSATLLAAMVASPVTVGAQSPSRPYRVAIVEFPALPSPPPPSPRLELFKSAMRELGWTEGQRFVVERRAGDRDRLDELAAAVVRERPALILTVGTATTLAAKKATSTIPIVMVGSSDPVASGIVENLSRPRGNVTGLSLASVDVMAKRLDLLKSAVPRSKRIALVLPAGAGSPNAAAWIKESETAARALGVKLHVARVDVAAPWDTTFSALRSEGVDALVVTENPRWTAQSREIAAAALKHRLPSIAAARVYVDKGGLMSYGADLDDLWRHAASLVDKILRGANPGDLPVEEPTKFELALNLGTAKALGIEVPAALRLRATAVVE